MKWLRIISITFSLILLGIVIMIPTENLIFKLIIEMGLMGLALFWYLNKSKE